MKILALVSTFFVSLSCALAAPHATPQWSDLANGKHSFKTLGTDFYVDVPVRRIPDERVHLAFVNLDTVKKLGLALPTDPKAAEAFLKDLFAWEVDPDGKSEKKWFATHYQDSNAKGPGEAQGDGRALWTGELKLKAADGSILYVDGVQKGVGPTPYAWLNNSSHKDGKQNTNELIVSGIRSMADVRNQLDSTSDILGFVIRDPSGELRSMTLRVGRQTRPAHIRYFSDEPANEKKLMDYIVTRDLGLPIGTSVTDEMFLAWELNFARNNGEDTARVFALNAFYEHPTMGNKTTTGGSVDLNGRQYLDAYHVNLTHLYGRLNVGDQVQYQREYIGSMYYYLKEAKYRTNVNTVELKKNMEKAFNLTFETTASKIFLNSLGLSQVEIDQVPREVRLEVFRSIEVLMRATGNSAIPKMMMDTTNIVPASFETRKILRGTMAAFALSVADRTAAMAELYKNNYKWNTTRPTDHEEPKARYEAAITALISSTGGRVNPAWIKAAALRTKLERFDSTSDGVWDKWGHPIREKAEAGQSWVHVSNQMQKAANSYVDPQRPERTSAMLKPLVEIRAPSCSTLFGVAG